MNELISIIVPIYKVEKYLDECIKSIIKQTYKNIEIILVDDGSPDDCGNICDNYAKEDNRIKVIHKKNGGLSDARNKGIDVAKGRYITFIDSDDYVEFEYIEKLYSTIKENNTLISQCSILKINNRKEIKDRLGYEENCIKTGIEMINDLYSTHLIENVVVWNKMYNIELFKELRFPFGKIHEDEFTTYKIFYNVDKVAIIDNYLYNYRQTDESIIGKKFSTKRLELLEAIEQRLTFFKEHNEIELYEKTLKYYLEQLRVNYIKMKLYIENSIDDQKKLIKKYRKNYKKYIEMEDISAVNKLKALIFYVSPNMFFKMKKKKY